MQTTTTPPATLREQLAKDSEERNSTSCMEDGNGAFIEFLPSPHVRVGYGTGQLLHYHLTTRLPDLADDPTKPPQTLVLGFATADVVVSGQRLELVCQKIGDGKLVRVRALAER